MIKKAVLPVAGFGTRFLPASKAIPKEMLPIIDKPLLQYAVEEAVNIGVDEIISEFNNDEIISESKLFLRTHLEKSESFAIKIDNKEIRNILLDVNKYLVERSTKAVKRLQGMTKS